MCGRYTHLYSWEELHRLMSLTVPGIPIENRYNVAPSQQAPVVRLHSEGKWRTELLRWGLVPSWAKDSKIAYKLINARSETIAVKPSFRSAFKARRCLIPASGFYEWQKLQTTKQKQAYYIRSKGDGPIVFAGLWERWKPPQNELIESYSIITTNSNDLIRPLHDRMPVILEPKSFEKWLEPDASPDELNSLLKPCSPELLRIYRVSSHVNSPKNDDAQCIQQEDSSNCS